MVECQLPKLDVAGSSPVARSKLKVAEMTKRDIVVCSLLLTAIACSTYRSTGQRAGGSRAERDIRLIEERMEAAVLAGDTTYLSGIYADDFRFTHGSGQVNTKEEMLKLVAFRPFLARVITTDRVEINGGTAKATGSILVTRKPRPTEKGYQRYTIRYVRIYHRVNGQWQLGSHTTTEETPPKPAA